MDEDFCCPCDRALPANGRAMRITRTEIARALRKIADFLITHLISLHLLGTLSEWPESGFLTLAVTLHFKVCLSVRANAVMVVTGQAYAGDQIGFSVCVADEAM
jgi:hypothetical protein